MLPSDYINEVIAKQKQPVEAAATAFLHPALQNYTPQDMEWLPWEEESDELYEFDRTEKEISTFSKDKLQKALKVLKSYNLQNGIWYKLYSAYLNDSNSTKSEQQSTQQSPVGATQMQAQANQKSVIETPETLAASDVRVLDVIEASIFRTQQKFKQELLDDLVLAVQEYMKAPGSETQAALALLADTAKLRGVFKLVQQIKNSPEFIELVDSNTPDELPTKPSPKLEVVAVATTAEAIANQSQAKAEEKPPAKSETLTSAIAFAHPSLKRFSPQKLEVLPKNFAYLDVPETKIANLTPEQLASNIKRLESTKGLAMSLWYKVYNAYAKKPLTQAQSESSPSEDPKPSTSKTKTKRPMPTIVSIEALEAMTRAELIAAMGAVNDNKKTNVRANASTSLLQETLALHLLGVVGYKAPTKTKAAKTPKAPKAKKEEPVLDLPEGLTWDECKDMSYRQLQYICKCLRSQKLWSGNLAGKGIDTKYLRGVVADYFKGHGVDIATAEYSAKAPTKDLHLPNWGAIKEQKRLEKATTAALKLDNQQAKVELELAVA